MRAKFLLNGVEFPLASKFEVIPECIRPTFGMLPI